MIWFLALASLGVQAYQMNQAQGTERANQKRLREAARMEAFERAREVDEVKASQVAAFVSQGRNPYSQASVILAHETNRRANVRQKMANLELEGRVAASKDRQTQATLNFVAGSMSTIWNAYDSDPEFKSVKSLMPELAGGSRTKTPVRIGRNSSTT